MKRPESNPRSAGRQAGSVLIIVLWIAFGLVAITLYFANTMSSELRAADNRVAALVADQAIEGAARYVARVLTEQATNGMVPYVTDYANEAAPVGEAHFWLIGRDHGEGAPNQIAFGLVDEGAKLNLNNPLLTQEMLERLPRMTPEFAAAIVDWRIPTARFPPAARRRRPTPVCSRRISARMRRLIRWTNCAWWPGRRWTCWWAKMSTGTGFWTRTKPTRIAMA